MLKKLLVTLATSSALFGAVAAVPAHASTNQESVFEDDTALLFSGDAQRQQSLDEIKSLGGTTIRTLVQWSRIAPNSNDKTKPAGFDATDPNAYPPGAFAPWDQLVQEAQDRGLQVIMSPVLAPHWADTCKGNAHHCSPRPKDFGQFVTALGRRYPTVHRWSIWNEPNISSWLYPQQKRVHGHNIPTAAIVYRNLFNAATGIAHHPYNRGGGQPPLSRPTGPGEITIANLSSLSRVINQGSRNHRIRGGLKFFFTEFGFQSNPPDHTFGVSLARQARYINQSDYIAYHNRRVSSVAQYELFDDTDIGSFNTGLRRSSGKAKLALGAYRLPIWVTRSGSGVKVWGQVRPGGAAGQTVQIQNGKKQFKTVKTVRTGRRGYFEVRVGRKPGPKWRLVWTSGSSTFKSRVAGIGT